MQQEIHVKSSLQGFVRIPPLGYQHCIRIFPFQKVPNLLPQGDRPLSFRVILYQRICHIYPEAVAAHLQPETHNILHRCQRGQRPRGVYRLLPGFLHLVISVIQGRLTGKIVHHAGSVPVSRGMIPLSYTSYRRPAAISCHRPHTAFSVRRRPGSAPGYPHPP